MLGLLDQFTAEEMGNHFVHLEQFKSNSGKPWRVMAEAELARARRTAEQTVLIAGADAKQKALADMMFFRPFRSFRRSSPAIAFSAAPS
jgi:hypothetical protein